MDPPIKPSESDCCNSGCNPCILDVYDQQLKKYNSSNERNLTTNKINAISATSYTIFKLVLKKLVAESTFLMKFEYSDNGKVPNNISYSPGQYFFLKAKDFDGEFSRPYTPIPLENSDLSFTVLVKLYEGGRMSRYIRQLEIGSATHWRGPYGNFRINYEHKYFLFIAQGVGISPIISVITEMIQNEDCESFIKLFYCVRNCDILLGNKLHEFASYWNFSYEVFTNTRVGFKKKYNEVIHDRKLRTEDVSDYVTNKIGVEIIICGSTNFSEHVQMYARNSGVDHVHVF